MGKKENECKKLETFESSQGQVSRVSKESDLNIKLKYLVQFASHFGESVALLQGSGTRPFTLFGQSTGELFVLSSLFFELLR